MPDWFAPSSWFDSESWFDPESPIPSGSGGFSGDVEIKLELGSFTVEPFLWPHLADKITVDWSDPNIDTCQVFLEAFDGTRVLLNDNAPGVAKSRPYATCTKYAGSWKQDFGAGIVTDEGADETVAGDSAGHMADAHLATAFQMLADRTAKYLVWVITPVDSGDPVSIDTPIFEYTKSAGRKIVWENAHQAAIIHESGAGVRTGIFDTGTSGTLTNPPNLYDPTERPNAIDWLVTERLLVEGIAHDDGLTTELSTRFDSYEGQSVGTTRSGSWGFWLPVGTGSDWHMAIVSGMAEFPSLGIFARRERDTGDWTEDGDFVQHTWAHAQDYSYFVNPQEATELREDDDTTVWTSVGGSIVGWGVSRHRHAVDNTETDFGIWLASTKYGADIRPWRGYYSVVTEAGGSGITYTVGRDLAHYLAYIDGDGFVVTKVADNGLNWRSETQAFEATWLHYAAVRRGTPVVFLSYSDGTNVYHRSSDDGLTFSSATTIGTGTRMVSVHLADGGYFLYYYDSGDVLGEEYDAAGTQIGSSFTAVSGVDDTPFDADESSKGSGSWRILMHVVQSGSRVTLSSTDGRIFS